MKGLADLDLSRGRHPFYGLRHEIRAPKVDPTTMIQITIETIDRSDGQDKIAGFAFFPLFLHMGNKHTVTDRLATNILLQNGRYQIPLYKSRVPVEKDLTLENIMALEKIPCASVLVRCYKAPVEGDQVLSINQVPMEQWMEKRLVVNPPDYQDGVYNTSQCQVSQLERMLFDIKQARPNPPMRQVVEYVMKMRQQVRMMRDPEIIGWLDKQLTTNPASPTVDLKYFSAYVPELGFRFGIERLHGLKERIPHICITSIMPPGSLYNVPAKNGPDVHMFLDYDVQSPWSSIQFLEDMLEYSNLPVTERIGFLVDVKGVKFSGGQVQVVDVAWTFFPIQVMLENEDHSYSHYINSGLFSVPLWQGPVRADLVRYAARTDNPFSMLQQDRSLKRLENASVIIRILDKQREQVPNPGDYRGLDHRYMPEGSAPKHVFSVDKLQRMDTAAPVGAAPDMPLGDFKAKIVQAASEKFGLE